MATYSDIGIPIRKAEVGEGALLLDVLTKYHGIVSSRAPGARKLKSRKRGNFEIGAVSKFSFAEGKNKDVMLEAELLEYFPNVRKQKKGTFLIMRMCKLSSLVFAPADEEAYSLLYSALKFVDLLSEKLSEERIGKVLEWTKIWYEYAVLRWAGLIDEVDELNECVYIPKESLKIVKDPKIQGEIKKLTAPVLVDIMPNRYN